MHPSPHTEYFQIAVDEKNMSVIVTGTTDCWHKLTGSVVATLGASSLLHIKSFTFQASPPVIRLYVCVCV